MEIWKDIHNFEGLYQVSSLGRIKSLPKARYQTRVINGGYNGGGYPIINLNKDKIRHPFIIHRLVASAFLLNPENKQTVNHKNGVKRDNRVENLEWATYAENNIHAIDIGLRITPRGKTNRLSIPVIQKDFNGVVIKIHFSICEAELATGVPTGNISAAAKGKLKTAGGFKWQYSK